MIGTKVKEKGRGGAEFEIVGEHMGGYVLAPVVFGPNELVTAAELQARFGVTTDEPTPVDEVAGWKVLGERFDAAIDRLRRGDLDDPGPSPEAAFRDFERIPSDDAKRLGHKR